MRKFKIGDRVRVVDAPLASTNKIRLGDLGTVQEGPCTTRYLLDKDNTINVHLDSTGVSDGWFAERFELVGPELTDEELATRYREGRKAFYELRKRGYTLTDRGAVMQYSPNADIQIFKYVTEEVPVIEKKQVRKDL